MGTRVEERRRKRMERVGGGECAACGRECDPLVEMATRDEDNSFCACDECVAHAAHLHGGKVVPA